MRPYALVRLLPAYIALPAEGRVRGRGWEGGCGGRGKLTRLLRVHLSKEGQEASAGQGLRVGSGGDARMSRGWVGVWSRGGVCREGGFGHSRPCQCHHRWAYDITNHQPPCCASSLKSACACPRPPPRPHCTACSTCPKMLWSTHPQPPSPAPSFPSTHPSPLPCPLPSLQPSTQYVIKVKTTDDAADVRSDKFGTISVEEERTRNNDMQNFRGGKGRGGGQGRGGIGRVCARSEDVPHCRCVVRGRPCTFEIVGREWEVAGGRAEAWMWLARPSSSPYTCLSACYY